MPLRKRRGFWILSWDAFFDQCPVGMLGIFEPFRSIEENSTRLKLVIKEVREGLQWLQWRPCLLNIFDYIKNFVWILFSKSQICFENDNVGFGYFSTKSCWVNFSLNHCSIFFQKNWICILNFFFKIMKNIIENYW